MPGLWWNGPVSRSPDAEGGLHPDDIVQLERRHTGAESSVSSIARVSQDDARCDAFLLGCLDLIQSDLWFSLENNILRDLRRLAPVLVLGPALGSIQSPRYRHSARSVADRQADGDLTIILLAQLAAVLTRHADGMTPFLRKTRIVNDPGANRPLALNHRKHMIADLAQQRFVRPRRLADKVQQRLMLGRDPRRRGHRRHRFYALALARHQQAQAVVLQGGRPIGVPM